MKQKRTEHSDGVEVVKVKGALGLGMESGLFRTEGKIFDVRKRDHVASDEASDEEVQH